MNTQDEQAWQREFEHVESKQKQREGLENRQVGTIGAIDAKKVPPVYLTTVALAWSKGVSHEK